MTTVQLGWVQKLFDKIFNKILDPVFDWISSMFSTAFSWIVDKLGDAISWVMETFLGDIIKMFLEWFFFRFYSLLAQVLVILDCIEDAFNVISGLSPVYKKVGGKTVEYPLISAVFTESSIQRILGIMIVVGFALCFLCAILATVKSMLEWEGQKTKPVGHVMRQTAKAMFFFLIVPLVASFLLYLSTAVLKTVDQAFTEGSGKTSVARTIFAICALDAVDEDKYPEAKNYNASYDGIMADDFGLSDKFRAPYYYKYPNELIPNYANPIEVKKRLTFRSLDYVIGFGTGIYFNIVLGMVLFTFICRIFDSILLVISEPFFVAMMPLDDGEHYQKWSELFIGKLFSGFGLVISMRLYLTIVGLLFENQISFVDPASSGARLQNYLIKLIFMAGGAMAIRGSGPLITSILSQGAAQSEQEQAAIGASIGGKIASFQGKRLTSLLKKTGESFADNIGAPVLAGIGWAGAKTGHGIASGARWVGRKIGLYGGGSGGDDKKMQFSGGAPSNGGGAPPNHSGVSFDENAEIQGQRKRGNAIYRRSPGSITAPVIGSGTGGTGGGLGPAPGTGTGTGSGGQSMRELLDDGEGPHDDILGGGLNTEGSQNFGGGGGT